MNAARCREGSWLSSHFPPRRRAAQAAIANGSRECAPDDKLRVLRRFVKEWRIMLLIRLGAGGDGIVSRQRRRLLRQRTGDPARWRPDGVDAICGQADLIRRSRAPDAAQRAALAAWCAAEPGPIVVADRKRGSRFCGAALHAAPRPGHEPSGFPIQYSNSRET